jgi:hypothetical protein
MTTIKISTCFDEPVTQESLDQAIVNGRKRTANGVRATHLQYDVSRQGHLYAATHTEN